MIRDRVYAEELAHDQGVSDKVLEAYLPQALDELVDRLFEGKSVGGLHLDAYVEKFASEISAEFIFARQVSPANRLETLIRRELEDSDAVRERAAELAGGNDA